MDKHRLSKVASVPKHHFYWEIHGTYPEKYSSDQSLAAISDSCAPRIRIDEYKSPKSNTGWSKNKLLSRKGSMRCYSHFYDGFFTGPFPVFSRAKTSSGSWSLRGVRLRPWWKTSRSGPEAWINNGAVAPESQYKVKKGGSYENAPSPARIQPWFASPLYSERNNPSESKINLMKRWSTGDSRSSTIRDWIVHVPNNCELFSFFCIDPVCLSQDALMKMRRIKSNFEMWTDLTFIRKWKAS